MIDKPNLFIMRHITIIVASLLIYLGLSWIFGLPILSYGHVYAMHEIRVFIAFFLSPAICLYIFRWSDGIYGGKKGFFVNLGIYALFMPTMIFLLRPLATINYGLWHYIVTLGLTSIQVASVDFFTRRFIQYPISVRYGTYIAIFMGIVVWLFIHIMEIIALSPIYGFWNILILVIISGVFLAVAYECTYDITGQMAGHIMINAVFMAIY